MFYISSLSKTNRFFSGAISLIASFTSSANFVVWEKNSCMDSYSQRPQNLESGLP